MAAPDRPGAGGRREGRELMDAATGFWVYWLGVALVLYLGLVWALRRYSAAGEAEEEAAGEAEEEAAGEDAADEVGAGAGAVGTKTSEQGAKPR